MAVIIFDLDGTLINTGDIAIDAYKSAMAEFSVKPADLPTDEQILKTFGLPDREIWQSLMPNHTAEEQMAAFHLSSTRIDEAMRHRDILLPHAREVVHELHRRGYILTTASNCGERYLDAVMATQGIGHLFDEPLCLESVHGTRKADILRQLVARYGQESKLYLVGDRYTDRDAAAEVGMPFIGCDFGFGDASELTGAIYIVKDLPGLLNYFT
ncbi:MULTISPECIES: HAD family hydrolase [Alicyclobacillus]|uniref:HAD family hydrolase n=1 Tax=Alicyclobacillus acidoterrestris (strain ATCC 49025 / DSM 3922 / CIP 106132 / NCIMB 13137 / GD3B) TaxID=1356854 RepID=T0CXP4_ALIAG|nr:MULTISPECIES: HAD family hydrolase [Alicyclobacillus]EPZ44137.1 hypothetical protein N007_11480 [Alicyclobacillus acidoterrestris ATCC 49025]UNO49656.1 HAD family hydrolase [Alicyclobacillus acidoterrestris]